MKPVMKALLCYSIFFATALYSESEIRIRNLEDRITTLESHQKKTFEPITPNAGPKVKGGQDYFLVAEFIYWTARLDSFTYAKSGIGELAPQNVPAGNAHSLGWSWDPGFKVAFGWATDHGGWDIQLKYTWYYNRASDHTNNNPLYPGFLITPKETKIDTVFPIKNATANWNLHYQIGDLELGRNYLVNRFLKLRPFVGLKGTWQNQTLKNTFSDLFLAGIKDTYDVKARFHQEVWGGGILFGLNTSWQFTNWFNLYSDFAASALCLSYSLHRHDSVTVNFPHDAPTFSTTNIRETVLNIKPLFEWGIGLRMETYFCNNRFHILLQAGWEAIVWPNQTLYLSLSDHYDRFDLNIQGLTIKSRFDF